MQKAGGGRFVKSGPCYAIFVYDLEPLDMIRAAFLCLVTILECLVGKLGKYNGIKTD